MKKIVLEYDKDRRFRMVDINTYTSKELLFNGRRKYKKVFLRSETSLVYCEFNLLNLYFEKADWTCVFRIQCVIPHEGIPEVVVFDYTHNVTVRKNKNRLDLSINCGNDVVGVFWRNRTYEYRLFIDEQLVATTRFYFQSFPFSSNSINPFFKINSLQLSGSEASQFDLNELTYGSNFEKDYTRYVNCHFELENILPEIWVAEIELNFKSLDGTLKGNCSRVVYFPEDKKEKLDFILGHGFNSNDHWTEGDYKVEVLLFGEVIAELPFTISDTFKDGQIIESQLFLDDGFPGVISLYGYNIIRAKTNILTEEECIKKLEIYKKVPDEDFFLHAADVGLLYNNYGFAYERKKDHQKAAKAHSNAIDLYNKLIEAKRLNKASYIMYSAISYINMSNNMVAKKDFQNVEKCYNGALRIFDTMDKKMGGGFLTYIMRVKLNIGNFYSAKNEIEKAEQQFEEIIRGYLFSPEKDSTKTQAAIAEVFNTLAYLNKRKPDIEKTETYFKQALAIYTKLIPADPLEYTILSASSKSKLSNFFLHTKKDKIASLTYADQAFEGFMAYEDHELCQHHLKVLMYVFEGWGVDIDRYIANFKKRRDAKK